jgi:3-oxoadipate enol-lactonase
MSSTLGHDLEELPVVLLHGTSGKSQDWSQVVERLASHRSVIRPAYA